MGTQRSSNSTASSSTASNKKVTPPKGRPTRARNDTGYRKRAFGPVAQWTTLALLIALIVVVLVLVTDGGDFNPFNDDELPSQFGAPASVRLVA